VTGGLKLLPSPPAVPRSSVMVTSVRASRLPPPAAVATAAVVPLSEEALQQVPSIAPGWDKHALVEKYKVWVKKKGEMPRNPDAAFPGWVKKFTKDKRP
jgi:hypothetical protein